MLLCCRECKLGKFAWAMAAHSHRRHSSYVTGARAPRSRNGVCRRLSHSLRSSPRTTAGATHQTCFLIVADCKVTAPTRRTPRGHNSMFLQHRQQWRTTATSKPGSTKAPSLMTLHRGVGAPRFTGTRSSSQTCRHHGESLIEPRWVRCSAKQDSMFDRLARAPMQNALTSLQAVTSRAAFLCQSLGCAMQTLCIR